MIITAANCWAGATIPHQTYFDNAVVAARNANRANLPSEIYNFLETNHEFIRDGNEADFRAIEAQFQILYSRIPNAQKAMVDTAIKRIFDYSAFSRKCKVRWCAYSLCEFLDIKTCPYCNLSTEITIIDNNEGRTRPSIDHFFDKARYPLFAISLGNLVPCCHRCNSTFKGTNNFFINVHLNPLENTESVRILLDVDEIDARIDVRKLNHANIRLDYDNSVPRQANSVATFDIKAQYQARIDEIRQIAVNMVAYSTSGQNNTLHLGWVLRNVTASNYRNQTFGKLIRDLSSVYI